MDDLISRQAAIDALWKALYVYEDKTEKQFQESKELDIGDWIVHRIFVENMSDIDRQTILNLPSAVVRCKDCKHWQIDWAPSTVAPDFRYCGMIDGCTQAHDYCSKGEKKDGDPDA